MKTQSPKPYLIDFKTLQRGFSTEDGRIAPVIKERDERGKSSKKDLILFLFKVCADYGWRILQAQDWKAPGLLRLDSPEGRGGAMPPKKIAIV